MRNIFCLVVFLLLGLPALAQDQDELLRLYRSSWGGYNLHCEVFKRYFKVNASPDWWSFLCASQQNGFELVHLAVGVLDLAPGLGWADAKTIDDGLGSTGEAAPVLEALDSWKGKVSVTCNLPAGLSEEQKKQFMSNLQLVSGVVGWKHDCLPRGGKLFLTISASPKATEVGGTVSKDGNTYDLVLPVLTSITTGPLQAFFQKGMK